MRGSEDICAQQSEQEDSGPAVMAEPSGLQAQIAAVIEVLANSAVLEICRLVEDGYTALCSQMDRQRDQNQKENDVLRQKLRETDEKLRSCEKKLRRRRRQEKTTPVRGTPDQPVQSPGEETDPVFDPGVTSLASSPQPPPPSPTDVKVDVSCSPAATCSLMKPLWRSLNPGLLQDCAEHHTDGLLKPKVQPDDCAEELDPSHLSGPVEPDEPSSDHLNMVSLDLAWMQERAGHLGAAYAVAQLGLASTNTEQPLSSLLPQGGADSPPPVLFTGGANKMAAFSPSLDMTSVTAALTACPPSPPPAVSAASSASTPRHAPSRSGGLLGKRPVACGVCKQVFSGAAPLKLHQQTHTEERPYTCCHCGKGFAQPNNLRVHLLVHTGERRYRCTLCGKGFISSSHLKRHRTVHTQEKPYSCSRCGQSFSQMCSVRRHRQQSQCGLESSC